MNGPTRSLLQRLKTLIEFSIVDNVGVAVDTVRLILHHPANRRRRSKALFLYFFWQAWERTVRQPWTIRLGETLRIRLYPHSTVAALTLYLQIPEYEEMSFLRDYLRPSDLFIDVGANVGVYSLWASQTDAVQVLAFEPSSVTYERALENVTLNGLRERVRLIRKAVGAEQAVVPFTSGLDAVNHVLDAEAAGTSGSLELVEQTTLDASVPANATPSVIKIDVEGHEVDVLQGGRITIAQHRPALIIEANDVTALTQILDEMGYRTWSYDPLRRVLTPVVPLRHSNVIALADVDAARERLREADYAPLPSPS